MYSREKGEGQAAGLPFPFLARIYTKNGPISQISDLNGVKVSELPNKTRFKVHFQNHQGKLWRVVLNSELKAAAFKIFLSI